MDNKLTELVFILDRSGSMSGLEKETISGFNELLAKQKLEKGKALVTTVLFDHAIDFLYEEQPLEETKTLTDKEYFVRGSTALLDAIGQTINKVRANGKAAKAKGLKPDQVIFVITTDGYENSSEEYSYTKIKKMVEDRRKKGWEFIFLGANIDAIGTASRMGMSKDMAADYVNDEVGIKNRNLCVGDALCMMRSSESGKAAKDWKKLVEEDMKKRGR